MGCIRAAIPAVRKNHTHYHHRRPQRYMSVITLQKQTPATIPQEYDDLTAEIEALTAPCPVPASEPTIPACNVPGTDSNDGVKIVFTGKYYGPDDHLGSTRMVIDDNAQIVEATMYSPYGMMEPVPNTSTSGLNAREKFTSKEFDEDGADSANGVDGIQAYYFGARYYDPEVGVWLTRDAAGQFMNPYGYSGNPVIYVDPDGNLFGIDDILLGIAIGMIVNGAIQTGQMIAGKQEEFSLSEWFVSGLTGGVTAGAGSAGTDILTNAFYSAFGNAANYSISALVPGQEFSGIGLASSFTMGLFGGFLPTYAGLNKLSKGALASNWQRSVFGEMLYGAGKGALLGGMGSVAATGDIGNFGKGFLRGGASGFVSTGMLIAYSGRLYNTGFEEQLAEFTGGRSNSLWAPGVRKGGIDIAYERYKDEDTKGQYSPLTGQINVVENKPSRIGHEYRHYFDVIDEGIIGQERNYGQYPDYKTNPYEVKAKDYGKRFDRFLWNLD